MQNGGMFSDKEEAARAYDLGSIEMFGEDAVLNFPLFDYWDFDKMELKSNLSWKVPPAVLEAAKQHQKSLSSQGGAIILHTTKGPVEAIPLEEISSSQFRAFHTVTTMEDPSGSTCELCEERSAVQVKYNFLQSAKRVCALCRTHVWKEEAGGTVVRPLCSPLRARTPFHAMEAIFRWVYAWVTSAGPSCDEVYQVLEKLITDFGQWKLPQLPVPFGESELQPRQDCVTTLEGWKDQPSTNFHLTRIGCLLARRNASGTNRGVNYTIQQVVNDNLVPMEVAPSASSESMRECVKALTSNTALTYDCAGVRLETSADFTWTAWGHSLGGGHWPSSGLQPLLLPRPTSDHRRLMVVMAVESAGGLLDICRHLPEMESEATAQFGQLECLGIAGVDSVMLATSGFPSRHFYIHASQILRDAAEKWYKVLFVHCTDPDVHGDNIHACVMEALGPLIKSLGIHSYAMMPGSGNLHVCGLTTTVGEDSFARLFAIELAREVMQHTCDTLEARQTDRQTDQCHAHGPSHDLSLEPGPLQRKFDQLQLQGIRNKLLPDYTAHQIGLGKVAQCIHGLTMLACVVGGDGNICFQIVLEDWGIRCPVPLPLQHVLLLGTVLPPDTTLAAALDCMVDLRKTIGTSQSQQALQQAVQQPLQYYVVNFSNHRVGESAWDPDVVPQLTAYMLGFMKKIRKKQQDRDHKTINVTCKAHRTEVYKLKNKLEELLKNKASSSTSTTQDEDPAGTELPSAAHCTTRPPVDADMPQAYCGPDLSSGQLQASTDPPRVEAAPLGDVTNTLGNRWTKRKRTQSARMQQHVEG